MIITRYDLKRIGLSEAEVRVVLKRVTETFDLTTHDGFAKDLQGYDRLVTHFSLADLIMNQRAFIDKVPMQSKEYNKHLLKELVSMERDLNKLQG